MLRILYCSNPLAPAEPEPDFAAEAAVAGRLGLPISLIDHEALERDGDLRRCLRRLGTVEPGPALYRGWMLRAEAYERLCEALAAQGLQLITPPDRYALAHHWPEAYPYLTELTAGTCWIAAETLNEGAIVAKLAEFGSRPVVIKDWVKSQAAGYWNAACFIPDPSDTAAALSVVRRFLDLQGNALAGGVVFRDFIALSRVGDQTEEWRVFVVDGIACSCDPRFAPPRDPPPADLIAKVAGALPSRFFSADFARRVEGGWSLIEVGDGQVSALPSQADPMQFYAALSCNFGS